MTNIKILILSLVTVLSSTSIANAGIEDFDSHFSPIKVSIYGHTGQDPVYKSTNGNDGFFIPTKMNPKFDFTVIDNQSSDLLSYLSIEIDISSIGTNHSPEITDHYSLLIPFDGMHGSNSSSLSTSYLGGTIPAPPAFLLLMSGLLYTSRRKS